MSQGQHTACDVLGVGCYCGTPVQAADMVMARAAAGDGGYVCLCNVHVIVTAGKNPDLARALDSAWLCLPDGAPIAWLQRRNGHRPAQRVSGPDLMNDVLRRGRDRSLTHFLFGSTPSVLARLSAAVAARHPDVELAGTLAPPVGGWTEAENNAMLETVAAARADLIWCALGAPRQELWMARNAAVLRPSLVLGVGAAFDFLAGTKARAPIWMQRSGLEWLHRLASEPRRLGGRYLTTNTEFALRAVRERRQVR